MKIGLPPASSLRPPVTPEASGAAATPSLGRSSFREVMGKRQTAPAAAPVATEPPTAGPVGNALRSVAASHREMDRIIRVVSSGRSFTSAQLIGLQARVHRLSTEIDLASKLLEKATSGVKQAMSTQL